MELCVSVISFFWGGKAGVANFEPPFRLDSLEDCRASKGGQGKSAFGIQQESNMGSNVAPQPMA